MSTCGAPVWRDVNQPAGTCELPTGRQARCVNHRVRPGDTPCQECGDVRASTWPKAERGGKRYCRYHSLRLMRRPCPAEVRDRISSEIRSCEGWAMDGSTFCTKHHELHTLMAGDEPNVVDVEALAFLVDLERLLARSGHVSMQESEHANSGAEMGTDRIDLTGTSYTRSQWDDLIKQAPEDKQAELAALREPFEQRATRNKAQATIDTYTSVLTHWRTFCAYYNQPALPPDPRMVAAYFAWLAQRGRVQDGQPLSLAHFRNILSALNLEHQNYYAAEASAPPPPGQHPMVSRFIEGYARTDAPNRKPAHVLTADELDRMVIGALAPRQAMQASTLLAGLLIGSPATQISGPQLEMLAHATTEAVKFENPEDPGQGCAFLTLHSGTGVRHEVTVYPEPAYPAICPVRQLHAAVMLRRLEATGPMIPNAAGKPISRAGIIKNVRRIIDRIPGAQWDPDGWSVRIRNEFAAAFEGLSLAGRRNVAILLTATWAGLRRSEAGALLVGDIGFQLDVPDDRDQIVTIFVEKSKTDQLRKGENTPVGHGFYGPGLSAIRALISWLTDYEVAMGLTSAVEAEATIAAGRTPGSLLDPKYPLFPHILKNDTFAQPLTGLSGDAIGGIYAKCAHDAGIEARFGERLTSHGMRAAQTVILAENNVPLATANALARRADNSATGALYYRSARLAEATKPPVVIDGEARSSLPESYFAKGRE